MGPVRAWVGPVLAMGPVLARSPALAMGPAQEEGFCGLAAPYCAGPHEPRFRPPVHTQGEPARLQSLFRVKAVHRPPLAGKGRQRLPFFWKMHFPAGFWLHCRFFFRPLTAQDTAGGAGGAGVSPPPPGTSGSGTGTSGSGTGTSGSGTGTSGSVSGVPGTGVGLPPPPPPPLSG